MFNRKKYKEFALIQLKNRWKVAVLMTLIIMVVMKIFSIPASSNTLSKLSLSELQELSTYSFQELMAYLGNTNGNGVLRFIKTVIQQLVNYVFTIASLNVFIKMSRSPEPVSLKTFFEGLNDWKKGILAGLWETFWVFIWALISIPVSVAGVLLCFFIGLNENITLIFTFIFMIAGFIPAIIKEISYSQLFYLVVEYPELSIRKAMKISMKITEGYKWEVFKTTLSFIGFFLLSALTLGILDLWLTPFYQMTMTNVYHALLKDALETGKLTPEELN